MVSGPLKWRGSRGSMLSICRENAIALVEDAAHAHGAVIDGRKAGSLGLAGSFSFFSTKVLTTGEGGMVTTDDEKVYETARALRDHGRFDPEPNLHHDIGYNWRPSELHAVLGLEQLRRVEKLLERRRHIAHSYDEKLKALKISGINLLEIPPASNLHTTNLFCTSSRQSNETSLNGSLNRSTVSLCRASCTISRAIRNLCSRDIPRPSFRNQRKASPRPIM
jgi:dTDP-4-amino-4,6-dideoxygalactose transaminase